MRIDANGEREEVYVAVERVIPVEPARKYTFHNAYDFASSKSNDKLY